LIYRNKPNPNKKWTFPLRTLPLLAIWLSAFAGIAVLIGLGQALQTPLMIAPFGASCLLLFVAPEAPFAQPRNVVVGYGIGAAVGLLFLYLLGTGWYVEAAGVATAITVMQLARAIHPPAAGVPLVVLWSKPGWYFLLAPALGGAVCLVLFAVILQIKLCPTILHTTLPYRPTSRMP
jgi:CBS-domain-containing membrane protein